MGNFKNKSEAIIDLHNRGYSQDFILADENIFCLQRCELIPPDGFEITETYRFEGKASVKNNYVIYAVKSIEDDLKGILMTSYNTFFRGVSIHLWSKLAASLNG
jgi:hypothetical protein